MSARVLSKSCREELQATVARSPVLPAIPPLRCELCGFLARGGVRVERFQDNGFLMTTTRHTCVECSWDQGYQFWHLWQLFEVVPRSAA